MSKSFLISGAVLLMVACAILKNSYSKNISTKNPAQRVHEYKAKNVIGCSPFVEESFSDNQTSIIPLLKGWGNYRIAIKANNDSTQLYFNQGFNMFYGFHRAEAIASFKQALTFDSTSGACYLGLVLSYAPNINAVPYRQHPNLFTFLEKAILYAPNTGKFEKALIDAQLKRFNKDTNISRQQLNEYYVIAMKKVYEDFPENADAGALYADALMQLHPWDLYDKSGNPKKWTREVEGLLEKLLKKFPRHPGLNHYYVHCVEASNTAQRGLTSAKKLELLTPGMSHMVHMASHIYVRTGYYKQGVQSNEKAIEAYEQYRKQFPGVERGAGFYYDHSLSMQFANALMLPDYNSAIRVAYAKRLSSEPVIKQSPASLSTAQQYNYSFPILASIRYGKWDSILTDPLLNDKWIYASFLQHYARGLAFARNNRIKDAQKELECMQTLINDPILNEHEPLNNAPVAGCKVAHYTLMGVIAEEQKDFDKALDYLQKAVQFEDSMIYNEPKDWLLPARAYLGNALLKAGMFAKAETVFKKDMTINPDNIWSLNGLYLALKAQNNLKESHSVYKQVKRGLINGDIKLNGAVF
ncbi:MAG TPA: tetratricopeptide repeat-containing protein kinase family protein [Chitinophagaceae bacterium]|nr:tetratricopeptide repeat-containing protein kinase family protein [Chitinophagaceae bacterium]